MLLDEISRNLSINTSVEVLERLNEILDNTETTAIVSCLGTRKIIYKLEENSFSISLNKMATKVSSVSKTCREDGLDEIRRTQWISITKKISNFYYKTDVDVKKSNLITSLFVFIREFTFSKITQSLDFNDNCISSNVEQRFRAYSEDAYEELKESIGIKSIDGRCCFPTFRLLVHEEDIRRKVQMDKGIFKNK